MATKPKQTAHASKHRLTTLRRRAAKTKEHFSRHYYSLMPEKKHHRVMVWMVFLLVTSTIAAQMMYPINHALPFARLGNQMVGWQTDLELQGRVNNRFAVAHVRFSSENTTSKEYTLASVGVEPKSTDMTAKLMEYPFWLRFVPGSILWQLPVVREWDLQISDTPLREFSQTLSAELTRPPENAELSIENGQLIAKHDSPGVQVSAGQVQVAVRSAVIAYDGTPTIAVAGTVRQPEKTAAALADVRAQAEHALALPLQIQANNITFTPSREEKAQWLMLGTDASGKTTLRIDDTKLRAYLADVVTMRAGRVAGVTKIQLQNGREVGRETGETGLGVNAPPLIETLTKYLLQHTGHSPFVAEMIEIQPKVAYSGDYTTTRDGLQAYIDKKARWNTWISIQQLDGEKWSLGARDTESVVSGSTYKLYVALYLFKEMNEGKRDWNTPILGTTTNACFDRMTIASTNPCAEDWLSQFGRTNLNDYLYSRGFSAATTFTHPEAAHTSARDLTNYMIGLERGTLIGGVQRERLLGSLSRHPYRYGIPAGSKGKVWDKVGFVWDYVNDTAIVHHPRGTYVMTILTRGQSYGAIAAMTRDIERIMYP